VALRTLLVASAGQPAGSVRFTLRAGRQALRINVP
jgi:hypothetical protein